ncbi:MAG: T9SS type A sorting domain-containing protein [Ignavibacteria bacterium]
MLIYDSLIANIYLQDFAKRYSKAGGTIGIEQISNIVPSEYVLDQNYPDPFNPKTVINYSIPKSEKVSLKIFDALGREVLTLVNDIQTGGTYKVTFDATTLSSGIYFYTLTTSEFIQTKRMMLIK